MRAVRLGCSPGLTSLLPAFQEITAGTKKQLPLPQPFALHTHILRKRVCVHVDNLGQQIPESTYLCCVCWYTFETVSHSDKAGTHWSFSDGLYSRIIIIRDILYSGMVPVKVPAINLCQLCYVCRCPCALLCPWLASFRHSPSINPHLWLVLELQWTTDWLVWFSAAIQLEVSPC